jgi:hypothetical protein
MDPLPPFALANAVTGFSTLLAGLFTFVMGLTTGHHRRAWLFAYACIFITGVPTIGFHGLGEVPEVSHLWRVSDTGTNLLLAWALQVAVLGDFYSARFQRRFAVTSALVNLAGVAWMVYESFQVARIYAIPLGEHGGFHIGETLLIVDSWIVVGLLYSGRQSIPRRAMPLLHLTALTFLVGLGLASAANTQVRAPFFAYHALWHIVGGFGFVALWAFNEIRGREQSTGESNG